MRNFSCRRYTGFSTKIVAYRSLVGTDFLGYFGLRGNAKVFGRRNVTLLRILRVRVPNGPLMTFVWTLRALRTAAVAFFCFKARAALVGFLAAFDLAANLAPAFVVPAFFGTGFFTASLAPVVLAFGFGLAPAAALTVFLAASAFFLSAGFLAAAGAFFSAGFAVFLAAVAF